VGVLEADSEVCEMCVAIRVAAGSGRARTAGLRIVVVICENGDGCGVDGGGQHRGDVG